MASLSKSRTVRSRILYLFLKYIYISMAIFAGYNYEVSGNINVENGGKVYVNKDNDISDLQYSNLEPNSVVLSS